MMRKRLRILIWTSVVMVFVTIAGAPSALAESRHYESKVTTLPSSLLSIPVSDKLLRPLHHPEGRCASDVPTADFYYEDTGTYTDNFPGFIDVSSHASYCHPLRLLISFGAINGYSDNTFRPYNPVTRSQFSKMIVKAFGYSLISPSNATYADVPVGSPFFTFVETASAVNLVTGTRGDPSFYNICIPRPWRVWCI